MRRQIDFRHQQQRLLACRQGLLDQTQIDFRLAAAGHAKKQIGRKSPVDRNSLNGPGLFVGQCRQGRRWHHLCPSSGTTLRRIEAFETGGQSLQDHLAQRGLVILAGKFAEGKKIRRQRLGIAQDFACGFQLRFRPVALVADPDNHADPLTAPAVPERHPHPQADFCGRRVFRPIFEQAMQGQIESNAQNGHQPDRKSKEKS